MNQNSKLLIFTFFVCFILTNSLLAQGPGPPPADAPLDPASIAVLIGGGAVAVKKIRDKRRKKDL